MKWPTTVALAAALALGWTVGHAADPLPLRLSPPRTLEARVVQLELELRQTQDLLFDLAQDHAALLTRVRDLEDDMAAVKQGLRAVSPR
ncbi:MAG: hypothetical protein FJX65_03395 [Alphaproteobacteria bacterium]|nr:hypothetical protein [Alphaproteobacteria bacterium]